MRHAVVLFLAMAVLAVRSEPPPPMQPDQVTEAVTVQLVEVGSLDIPQVEIATPAPTTAALKATIESSGSALAVYDPVPVSAEVANSLCALHQDNGPGDQGTRSPGSEMVIRAGGPFILPCQPAGASTLLVPSGGTA